MRPLSLLIPACALLFSCHAPAYTPLAGTALYNADSVRLASAGGDESAAAGKLRDAEDLYKKSKDTAQVIESFKTAVLIKPTAKAYFELAGVLLAHREYDEAIKALGIAEKLGYTPLANVMFRYAYAYANSDTMDYNDRDKMDRYMKDEDNARHYMELAIQMGYAYPVQFLRKDLFPVLANSPLAEETYNAAVGGSAGRNPEKTLWETFMGQFPEMSLPLVVNREWLDNHETGKKIDYQYEKFIPNMRVAKFSRDEGILFYYAGLVKKNDVYTALLYGATGFGGDSTKVLFLATYDPRGKIIDRMYVAGRNELIAPFKVFTIQPNLQFQVQEFKNVYKEDPQTAGYDSSNITGQEGLPPVGYRISATGKLERTDAPLALR